jgi:COP9 signalosome complex subunit 5
MVTHAKSGGDLEIMGLMLGSIEGDTFIVTDAVRLPVEGTETRVNAQEEANEFTVEYLRLLRESGREENPVGWYHSHPGYGCWLSGIDVATQANWQTFEDPFLAVVIDPSRTMSQGKVEIGAFRTYPEDYKPSSSDESDLLIPQDKVKDFGAHFNRYYPLEVSYFKSTLDGQVLSRLWEKHWVSTLSHNPLVANRDYTTKQIKDLAAKLEAGSTKYDNNTGGGFLSNAQPSSGPSTEVKVDKDLEGIARIGKRIEVLEREGAIVLQVKDKIFNIEG